MIRGGGKRDDAVQRRAHVRQLQMSLGQHFRKLTEGDGVLLSPNAVDRWSSSVRAFQSKHKFMAYPERMDAIRDHCDHLRQKKRQSSELRDRIADLEADLLKKQSLALAEITEITKATKLAEDMYDLYITEWTNLFEATRAKLPAKHPDEVITGGIRDIIELCYLRCRELSNKQLLRVNDKLHLDVPDIKMTPPFELCIRESQLIASPFSLPHLYKIIKTEVATDYSQLMKRLHLSPYKTPLIEFLERCIELTWYSQIRDPPVFMEFSLLQDLSLYEPFSKRGPTIDHVVWPVLFLHETGPLLAKGVAKFNEETDSPQEAS